MSQFTIGQSVTVLGTKFKPLAIAGSQAAKSQPDVFHVVDPQTASLSHSFDAVVIGIYTVSAESLADFRHSHGNDINVGDKVARIDADGHRSSIPMSSPLFVRER